jgi:putative glutamine amidotransferase
VYESNWYHGGYDVSPRTSRLKGNLVEQHAPYRGHIVVVGQWREGQGGRIPVAYIDALRATGGVPKLVSTFDPGPGEEVPTDVDAAMGLDDDDVSPMENAVGLVLPGGGDIDPDWYGRPRHARTHNVNTRRDRFERVLMNDALRRDIPVLAICHGMQLLNVCLGGTLHQHLQDGSNGVVHDRGYPGPDPVHRVRIKDRSVLAGVLGGTSLGVNSHHHQGLDDVAGGLEEIGWAEDGLVECVASRAHSWVIGVQWHPEAMAPKSDEQRRLFKAFVAACDQFDSSREARATA